MTMIYTNDGLIGLRFRTTSPVIWCKTVMEAIKLMYSELNRKGFECSIDSISKDVSYAINHMSRTGDTVAEFGIFGGFMFTRNEPEYEF